MHPIVALVLLASSLAFRVHSAPSAPEFYDPCSQGGSMLDNAGTYGGEPLNVIISAYSTASVLTNSRFLRFARAMGFAIQCFDMHLGDPQAANLGDGNGCVNQTGTAFSLGKTCSHRIGGVRITDRTTRRFWMGTFWAVLGVLQAVGTMTGSLCKSAARMTLGQPLQTERQFRQFGRPIPRYAAKANQPFAFLVLNSPDVTQHHTISPDRYDTGRDLLVQHASGVTSYNSVQYSTTARAGSRG
ncbi:hypothetical protein DFH07DRAFT_970416 [Mycena maculata]|uniref:Carboxylic ester hydrolase n=1 Tax=Mycena maculata TaxID=230809 RepID=A0AAD7HT02_9AGAR|nr:hypothetical protein DFH07DRAFT_970416 [Mycena maculata]